jgi:hypothetical protein
MTGRPRMCSAGAPRGSRERGHCVSQTDLNGYLLFALAMAVAAAIAALLGVLSVTRF